MSCINYNVTMAKLLKTHINIQWNELSKKLRDNIRRVKLFMDMIVTLSNFARVIES